METAVRRRVYALVLAVLAISVGIGARLTYLQIGCSEQLRARASIQHWREIEVPATRGAILDRSGNELALSLKTESLFAHPRRVADPEKAATLLAPLVGRSRNEILKHLRSGKSFVYIERFLEPEEAAAVRALDLPIGDGQPFGLLPSSKRYYPRSELAVHVLGFANIDGKGVEGIEKQFDYELRGDSTIYLVLQDGLNGRVRQKTIDLPDKQPVDVILSVDAVLQHIVERELDRAMRETRAEAASAVLLDPRTGEVLALANRPAADPNHFGKARPEARINRAVVHQYEPGSTFKIVTMAAALERNRVEPNQLFNCENGTLHVGRRTIHDDTPHQLLSATQTLYKSSNICMVKIARLLEPDAFYRTILEFGVGTETGIELPGEQEGDIRAPADWSSHSRDSLAFGQEVALTVLQMASIFATLANDGIYLPPRVVLESRNPDGKSTPAPRPNGKRVISSRTTRTLNKMLEGVITRGTGKRARIDGYRLVGKSGTAQKWVDNNYSDTDYIASFGGFGPLPDPQLVCLVVIDTPRGAEYHGGEVAGPVFRRIMADVLARQRVPRDGEVLAVQGPSSATADHLASREVTAPREVARERPTGNVPDLSGLSLRKAVSRLAARGYLAEVQGQGFVQRQHPAAGSSLAPGKSCKLLLGTAETLR